MTVIFLITGILIFVYLAYPIWLLLFQTAATEKEQETVDIKEVSLILLSFNGGKYLKEKIGFLMKELSCFPQYEMIIVDDNSSDGSKETLNAFRGTENIIIITKNEQKGIPHSMNMAVRNAKYDYIIFCDQRQQLSDHILQRIVEPLKYREVGAVSGCISHLDKENRFSVIRRCENFIKSKESGAGSLIGVYGPLYAIKKNCYHVIPEDIILDDLYLSLRILKNKQIRFSEDCRITDESISTLYDYKRTRRYLNGFLQILQQNILFKELNNKQKIMLIWHKYLRLLIPVFIFLSYFCIGILIHQGTGYIILFTILTVTGLLSFLPVGSKYQFRLKTLTRMSILCLVGLVDVFINKIFSWIKQEPAGS